MNSLVAELADVAARERAVLNECESLFCSIAALQVRVPFMITGCSLNRFPIGLVSSYSSSSCSVVA